MRKLIAIMALTLGMQGCGGKTWDVNGAKEELEANRALWNASGIESYQITYRNSCYCISRGEYAIVVDNGEIVDTYPLDESDPGSVNPPAGGYLTVRDAFDAIETIIERDVYFLSVAYNPEFGYPEVITVDLYENGADDESTRYFSDLQL